MKKMSALPLAMGLCLLMVADAALAAGEPGAESRKPAALVDISRLDRATIDRLKSATGGGWWLELGDTLLVAGNVTEVRAGSPSSAVRELGSIAPDDLILHARGCGDTTLAPSLTLHGGLSYELMRRTASTQTVTAVHAAHLGAAEWLPVVPNTVLARRFEPGPDGVEPVDADILPIVSSVSAARWFGDVETLASFDRSSFSSELPASRAFIAQQFAALGLEISEPQFTFNYNSQPVTVNNVIGRWTGTRTPDDWIVVGGHYDSRQQVMTNPVDSPGADDNASGCSGVIEAARALTRFRPESTMIFMCYAGEEQGLHGSAAHVSALNLAGELGRVSRMANMDMIGWANPALSGIRATIETQNTHAALLQELGNAGATYAPELILTQGFNPCCTDLMPYLNAGRPAVSTIHGTYSSYPHYHRTTDTPANMGPQSQAIGGAIIRMNVAALARWSGASDLVFADSYAD